MDGAAETIAAMVGRVDKIAASLGSPTLSGKGGAEAFHRTVPGGVGRAVSELAAALGRTVHVTADSKPEKRSFLIVK